MPEDACLLILSEASPSPHCVTQEENLWPTSVLDRALCSSIKMWRQLSLFIYLATVVLVTVKFGLDKGLTENMQTEMQIDVPKFRSK